MSVFIKLIPCPKYLSKNGRGIVKNHIKIITTTR